MKRALGIFLLFAAVFTASADTLDQMSLQLDRIEQNFWLSLRAKSGEYREQTLDTLNKFAASAVKIQNFLVIKRLKKYGALSGSARTLQLIYTNAKQVSVRRFSFKFKPTTFKAYQSEFNRLQREKAADEADQGEGGKKKKKRSSRNTAAPGLKTVDLIEYERWLAEITADNQEKFLKARSNGNNSEVKKMQNYVNDYLTGIRQLRLVLAKIRQETKFTFDEK